MRKTLAIILAAGVILTAATLSDRLWADKPPAPDPNKPWAKAFTLTDQDGNKVSLSSFSGQIVVMEWVNFDCPFSRRHYEQGTFKDLYKKYKYGLPGAAKPQPDKGRTREPKQKVVWLAINSTHYATVETNKAAAQKYAAPYPVLDDREGKVGRLYGAVTTPHIFIKAPSGELVYRGAIDDDPKGDKEASEILNYVDQALQETLEGKPVSIPETKPYGCSVKYAVQQ
ncbi:MAG: redoxin domain-containing protein [Planctomycetes bacterium]|nr:redoxin domain-containing protein [Planctomycetota bacterium]